jgi:16S rRNA (uracil1498-N3)-methyltransferase
VSELWTWVDTLTGAGAIELTPDEARHVVARRLRVGDRLVVFDGRGRRAEAVLESLAKNATLVRVESVSEVPPSTSKFVLASAIPKGDRLSTMLQMLTQLGLEAWQPLVLEHSVVRKLDPDSPRLARILVESCKVSRRARLLDVRRPCSLEDALAAGSAASQRFYGDRGGAGGGLQGNAEWVGIGPEAGFSESEIRVLRRAGVGPIALGTHNLRIETAATAAAVAFHLAQGSDA